MNERHELMRVIMGAAFRDKRFVLAGFEKLLSAEGKAALAANREKAEVILDNVLNKAKGKGSFSFNIVYRLQAAVVELQKLGIELPPQINCFILSLVRLSNAVTEMNAIMNQCKAMLDATKMIVRPPVEVDDLDLVGKIFNEFATEAGQKMVLEHPKNPNGKKFPAYVKTLMTEAYGGSGNKPTEAMFKPGGEYYNKVLNRLTNAQNPLAEAEKLAAKLIEHSDRAHNQLQNFQLEANLDQPLAKFREDWAHANTPEAKTAAIQAFAKAFSFSEATILQNMMLNGRETERFIRKLEPPKTFASAITDILFDEFDALSAGLDEEEQGKLKTDVYGVATGELGLGYLSALKAQNIINAMVEDAQKMGGDKDYKVDIGV